MARSVVSAGSPRCARCCFTPRWCICAGFQSVTSELQVDVLMHWREFDRPSSTGRLINRLMPTSRCHTFRVESPPARAMVAMPGRAVWMLHPRGELVSAGEVVAADVQVVLLDGSWREAARMAQTVGGWGKLVRLPLVAPSRYWLRKQQGEASSSTIEALIHLLGVFGETEAAHTMQLQFELHVYAGLRARGALAEAETFLQTSPICEAYADLLAALHERRPLVIEP